jgi:hypothetical protein
MDCEKFDLHVIDALYDELDEVTFAAMKRHMEGCSRCASAFSRLRATRDVGVLPLTEPSEGLEDRILAAVSSAQRKTSWTRKALRGLAWAGSHAMRPQLAMAALFVLVIGSSLLLLRPKPASMPAPVRVTERGVPAAEVDEGASPPGAQAMAQVTAAPAPVAAAEPSLIGEGRERSAAAAADGARSESQQEAKEGGANDAKSALADARAVRQRSGCGAAVKAYNEVGTRFPATVSAADAMWEAAECYKAMGDASKARELYLSLRSFSSYRDRAEQELAADASSNPANNSQMASKSAAGGGTLPKSAAAAPAPRAAAKARMDEPNAAPAATAPAGAAPGKNTPAAPMRNSSPAEAYGF